MTLEMEVELRQMGEKHFYFGVPKAYINKKSLKVGNKYKLIIEEFEDKKSEG
jgi:hypothetical protein